MVSEDNGARWLGCYGNPAKPTPNLDKFAQEGFRFTHTYASIPVCAPQRFTWITGINAISAGTQGMRSSVPIPEYIKYYPEIFRELGYYASKGNDGKTDYNHKAGKGREPNNTWNDSKKINWDNLKNNQPFIHVFNTHDTHEWSSFGGFKPNKDKAERVENLAKYHPDIPEMHYVYGKYNDAHRKMDKRVAGWLKDLEDSGMAEDTIVIYSSDHGGVLPRSKRYLYNSGTHCPLIIRIPKKYKHLYPAAQPGTTVDELVSFTDFPKTWLSLGGASKEQLNQMQGRIFLGETKEPEPKHVYSFRNRMDDRFDMVRSSRDHKHLYIRNYLPFVPVGQYQAYCYNSASMRGWNQQRLEGKTSGPTQQFFKQPRDVEELFLYHSDYDNVENLAHDPSKASLIKSMRASLRTWQLEIFDSGYLPEDEIGREAKKHDLTVYEFVRKPELYPLEAYMDLADLSLESDIKNLPTFIQHLKDERLGMRYWSILGILNLSFAMDLENKEAIRSPMTAIMNSSEESHVLRAYSAWAVIRLGQPELGLKALYDLSKKTYTFRSVTNILDWMNVDIALPLLFKMYLNGEYTHSDQAKGMVKKILEHASPAIGALLNEHVQLGHRINNHKGRLKKFKKGKHKLTPEKLKKEQEKSMNELDRAKTRVNEIVSLLKELPLKG
jgi:arylsulfatase A-like enzyme